MGTPDSIKELGNPATSWWTKRYLVDYFTCFGLFFVMGIAYFVISPNVMEIPLERKNPTVSYTYKDSSVSTPCLFVISVLVPLAMFFLVHAPHLVEIYKLGCSSHSETACDLRRKTFHDLHNAVFGLFESLAIMSFVMMFFKLFAGRDRPNHYALIDRGDVSESRESFPSGHSSFTFTGLTFLTLWLLGRFHALGPTRPKGGRAWLVFLCFVPAFSAAYVAITRTRDNWHNFSDILCGAVIGVICAVVTYFTLYPGLTSKCAGLPKTRKNCSSSKENYLPY